MSNIVENIKGVISRNAILSYLLENPDPEAVTMRGIVIRDMCQLLRRLPMSQEEAVLLYDSIAVRLDQKPCSSCQKIKPVHTGEMRVHVSGDLSKPRNFYCEMCK